MSLITCPECGKQISDKSKACIHCGFPIPEPKASLNKRTIACLVCGTEYFVSDCYCPKCQHPFLSLSKSGKRKIKAIEAYRKEIGFEKQEGIVAEKVIEKEKISETIVREVPKETITGSIEEAKPEPKPQPQPKTQPAPIPEEKAEKQKIETHPGTIFFWFSVVIVGFLGLLDGSFFDLGIVEKFSSDQYGTAVHQLMECYESYACLAYILLYFIYSRLKNTKAFFFILIAGDLIALVVFEYFNFQAMAAARGTRIGDYIELIGFAGLGVITFIDYIMDLCKKPN